MKTIQEQLPDDVKALIAEHNTNGKLNTFLYKNNDCNELIKLLTNEDRFQFVNRSNKIEYQLIEFVHSLDGRNVIVMVNDKEITGTIVHPLKRKFEGREYDNNVSFRREYEDDGCTAPETIALWIQTGDRYTTHLYTINKIVLLD